MIVTTSELEGVFVVSVHLPCGRERDIDITIVSELALIAINRNGATNLQVGAWRSEMIVCGNGIGRVVPGREVLGYEYGSRSVIRQCLCGSGKGDTRCIGNSGASPGLLGRS